MFLTRNVSKLRNIVQFTQVRYKTFTVPVKLDEKINADLEKEIYKPKDHEGRIRMGVTELPGHIIDAITDGVPDNEILKFVEVGAKLDRHLMARHMPMEEKDIFAARRKIEKEMKKQPVGKLKGNLDDVDSAKSKQIMNYEVQKAFSQRHYKWQQINYDKPMAWSYLFGRAAKEYAAILKTFTEIAKRDPEFKPRSFFDFGAGVGTGTWAASQLWKKSIYEYFLVDESREMNDLSEFILRGGNEHKNIRLKNIFYRQFLPASDEMKSHLILSAFSLMELQNLEKRLDVLLTLWKKCDGYMVIIENGSPAGFKLIEEAREIISEQARINNDAYIFAPCPHEEPCPRALENKDKPCNFSTTFRPLRFGPVQNDGNVIYSYVIFKKGSRSNDPTIIWPRLVSPTILRSKHVRCKLCTHRGKLEEIVLTKRKHSKYAFRCAKKSDWGDRLPIEFEEGAFDTDDEEIKDIEEENENTDDESKK